MRPEEKIARPTFRIKFSYILMMLILEGLQGIYAQTLDVVVFQVDGNGEAFASHDCSPPPPAPPFPLITYSAFDSHAFIPWVPGGSFWGVYYDYIAARSYKPEVVTNCGTSSANNNAYLHIRGDDSTTMLFDWQNWAHLYNLDEPPIYYCYADNYFSFHVKVVVMPGGGYDLGDDITVYYQYDIFGCGDTRHENIIPEDSLVSINTFFINNTDLLGPNFNFLDPPLPPPFPPSFGKSARVLVEDSLQMIVGDTIDLLFSSWHHADILPAGYPDRGAIKDWATGNLVGHVIFSVYPLPELPRTPKVEFTLDIGSDSELSDPVPDLNEVFDPGDIYIKDGPFMPAPANGNRNDAALFNLTDPWPDPANPLSVVPCGSGTSGFMPGNYFEIDDFDLMQSSMLLKIYGQGIPSISYFQDSLVYSAGHMLLSMDDDWAENWSFNQGYFSVPVNSTSTLKAVTYGTTVQADEVIALDMDPNQFPSIPFTTGSLWSESDMHINLVPNPDLAESADDDINGLKYFPTQACDGILYFSVDNEASYIHPGEGPLDPGSIYQVTGPGTIARVIKGTSHLGLNPGTDINAFTFGWVWDSGEGRQGLALLFSVDADDWTTLPDESGGLDPAMIYYSFLNGSHSVFLSEPMEDNIDAMTTVPFSFNQYIWPGSNLDFGDAPEPGFPTTAAMDGARHTIDWQTYLGSQIDAEPDGQPTTTALGDDHTGLDDEDGVEFQWPLAPGNPCRLKVKASVSGAFLNGWLDFNGDGTWSNPNEQVFTDLPLYAGDNYLTFITPPGAVPGTPFSRFRFSHQQGLDITGPASDGEVEDYKTSLTDPGDIKWQQPPDMLLPGLHADAGNVIADDWVCQGGVITDIHWWGNYELASDGTEIRGSGIDHFVISIYSDNGCLPGSFLFSYDMSFFASAEQITGLVNIEGSMIYKYDFLLPDPFVQQAGETYWVSIQAFPVDISDPPAWRWQEANRWYHPVHCGAATEQSFTWSTILWPGHVPAWQSDLAFVLTSWVTDYLSLTDMVIKPGQNQCFDANLVIIVAGNNTTFDVLPGGSVTLIAGERITFLPDTRAFEGSYLHGYITTTGQFCSTLKSGVAGQPAETGDNREIPGYNLQPQWIKVYPNPTTGKLTFELSSREEEIPIRIEAFNLMGVQVWSRQVPSQTRFEISLSALPPGVYVLRVISGDFVRVIKVVKE